MSRLIVIEGIDGAGKRTVTEALLAAFGDRGAKAATIAFPRYGASAAADLARDALYGSAGDLGDSVYGMAALFALDRAGAAPELTAALGDHDVVLVDRYIASNAAYGAARLRQDADGEFVSWVYGLEVQRLGLPVPHAHVLLRIDPLVAAERASGRERQDATRARDTFEADQALQSRVGQLYRQLAERNWLASWIVADSTAGVDVQTLAETLLN
jgi:dTMP kinase